MPQIDYVFSVISPWAYMGQKLLVDVAKQYNCTIAYKPVNLMDLFSESGGLPLPQRHPLRQQYRWFELQRWREARNIEFNLKPKHWPFNFVLIDQMIIAASELGHDPSDLALAAMKGVWAEDKKLSDKDVVIETATQCGLPAEELVAKAESDEVKAIYKANTEFALKNGCFGSPTYWLNGEMFFGQDRLDHLADALRTGREPYKLLD